MKNQFFSTRPWISKVTSFFTVIALLAAIMIPITISLAQQPEKINICHKDGSSWKYMETPAGSSYDGHIGHGDFAYSPSWEQPGSDQKCIDNAPPTPPVDVCPGVDGIQTNPQDCSEQIPTTITVTATKVVCDSESDLPNWAKAEIPLITATTATDFVASHPNCDVVPWTFEWAPDGTNNPGDSVGVAGGSWTPFTGSVNIPAAARTWFREQANPDYIPFYGITDNPFPNPAPVSAEFYCNNNIYYYDNYEWIDNTVAGENYHCIGFNVLKTPPAPDTATISAKKIVCDSEDDLPNWGAGDVKSEITSTTATEFLADDLAKDKKQDCHLEPWNFAWSANGVGNPGDELTGTLGAPWTTFTTTATIPAGARFWVREEFQNGYIPFTGQNTDQPVSAELYCGSDVLNYDNWEYMDTVAGETYHCVAFNVPTTPPLSCNPEENLLKNGGFETPDVSAGNYGIFPQGTLGLEWLVDWVSAQIGTAGLEIQDNVAGAPAVGSGDQFAELDGNHPVKIWQDVPTIPGQKYTLSFKYSPRPNVASNNLEAWVDGTMLAALSGVGGGITNWASHSYDFIADANTTVKFTDIDSDDSLGGYIDDVSLNCVECDEDVQQVIVSDTSTQVDNHNAAALTYIHPEWTATPSIPGATWIWATDPVESPTNDADLTKVFTKTFTIVGAPTSGILDVAADNNYTVKVNGNSVPVTYAEDNFHLGTQDQYDVTSYLITGVNTLEITVTNWEINQSADPAVNPAGLLYKLTVNQNECGDDVPPPPICKDGTSWDPEKNACVLDDNTSDVTLCKIDDDGMNDTEKLSGWTLMLLDGEKVDTLNVPSNDIDGVDSDNLNGLTPYVSVASGTWNNQGGANPVDAEYSTTDGWATQMDGYTGYQTDILELQINNVFDPASWGPYNSLHQYAQSFTQAIAGPANFRIFDGTGTTQNESWFGDNSGSLTVDIYKGYSGVTDESGCVTIEDVPFGTYTVDEIDQENWYPIAGLGTEVINQPSQTIYVENHFDFCPDKDGIQGSTEECDDGGPTNSSETIVVKSADLETDAWPVPAATNNSGKWFFYNDRTGSIDGSEGINNVLGSFVNGPASAPLGLGSAQISVPNEGVLTNNVRRNIATYQFKDVKLADIKTLQFSTYSQLAGDGALGLSERAPYLHFNVDFNNSDTWQSRLVYVPAMNGVVTPDTWQTWDAVDSGNALWVYSGATWPTTSEAEAGVPGTTMKTWSEIMVDYPNAETRSTDSWFGFRVGEPYPDGFTGNVDKFVIGVQTGSNIHTKTFDFEPTPSPARYTLTITTNGEGNGKVLGAGIDCDTNFEGEGNDCSETYDEGTNVDLTVTVDDGSTFDGSWSTTLGNPGTCTGTTTPCTVAMGGNVTLNAHFGVVSNNNSNQNTSGSRSSSSSRPQGEVLGASTAICNWDVNTYMRRGYRNNSAQVSILQRDLLNGYMKFNLTVDGVYGPKTEEAVKAFQIAKKDKILTPWGLTLPTGIFYKTTLVEAKNTICPEVILPIPTDLINWSVGQGVPQKVN